MRFSCLLLALVAPTAALLLTPARSHTVVSRRNASPIKMEEVDPVKAKIAAAKAAREAKAGGVVVPTADANDPVKAKMMAAKAAAAAKKGGAAAPPPKPAEEKAPEPAAAEDAEAAKAAEEAAKAAE